jgi:hypothetical protein
MKRWIGVVAFVCALSVAHAQAPFTIVRPAENSRVREKVRIQIPKNSLPPGGYVGIFLDGKFIEATIPPLVGRFHEYILDTKGRGLADTKPGQPVKLELVLYVDFNEQPRIVDRSSVNINIANSSSIQVPARGLALRYRFTAGTEWIYNLEQRTVVSSISEAQNRLGGRPAEFPVDGEKIRMLYAVDNVFENGDGLIRMQPLPERGKNYADLTVSGATEPQRYFDYSMAPIYMRLTPTGLQRFGAIPPFFPMEGTSGGGNRLDLFASYPLPTLPTKAVRPGDSWQSRFQRGTIDLEKLHDVTSVVRTFPARGEFVGVEWEMGRPCAKLRNVISAGETSMESRQLRRQGARVSDEKVTVSETIWFALDIQQVVKVLREETVETRLEQQIGGGGFGGFGGGRGPMGGPGGIPGPGGMGAPGGRGGDRDDVGQVRPGGGRGPMGGPMGGPTGFGGGFGGPAFGGAGRTAPQTQANFVKIRSQRIFTLEQ